jgi:hypothetical protein
MPRILRAPSIALLFLAAACGGAQGQATPAPATAADTARGGDPQEDGMIPAGYGKLNQDDITLRLVAGALEVRFVPLDERVIRLLAPDAYRALRDIRESRRGALDSVARQGGSSAPGFALVSFFAARDGQRFEPQDLKLSLLNQEFRAIGTVPISANFTSQQLPTRGQASAVYVFEMGIPVTQQFTLGYGPIRTDAWSSRISAIEREQDRIILRIRAARTDSASAPRP